MDEQACYEQLVGWLHPDGLACPCCHQDDRIVVHHLGRGPILDFRCRHCHRVFNAFTGTALRRIKRRPRELVLILRGFAHVAPTAQLARKLDCDRAELLKLRHRLQGAAYRNRDIMPLEDRVLKADETYQNAGERRAASRSGRPAVAPRQRVARARHLGERSTAGLRGGRASGRIRLTVTEQSDGETLEGVVRRASWPMATVNTDEWYGYNGRPEMGRYRATVCHVTGEWDDDADGVREVHINTLEGLWTGLRNFLRPFRGVNEAYLYQYVATFEWN